MAQKTKVTLPGDLDAARVWALEGNDHIVDPGRVTCELLAAYDAVRQA